MTVPPGFRATLIDPTVASNSFIVAGTPARGFNADVYLTLPSAQQIVSVDIGASEQPFASFAGLIRSGPGLGPFWPTIDAIGNYGGDMFVDDDKPGTNDAIWRVSPAGTATPFSVNASGAWDNDALAFDTVGVFGGDLFLVDGASASLYRFQPDGSKVQFATGIPDTSGGMAFSASGALAAGAYIVNAPQMRIYFVGANHVEGASSTIFTNLNVAATSLRVAPAGAFTYAGLYAAVPSQGQIVRVGSGGSNDGAFVAGLPGSSMDCAFSADGTRLWIRAGTELWLVECAGAAGDFNGDCAVNATDLAILLGAWGGAGGDLNDDGITNAADLGILLGAWTG
ncbi:MAG: hypothetical protein SGJ11_01630 [Phycisphaerae bacterium]|nr:hypothetical protein [Phycisphaerae bacterium]